MDEMARNGKLHRLFCENVRARRIELGLTQAQVAVKLTMKQPSYAEIENGRSVPGLDVVERVAWALKTDAHLLLQEQVAETAEK